LRKKGRQVITVCPDATLQRAAELLARHNIGVLLVVDAGDRPVGIISERDIVRCFAADGDGWAATTVLSSMTADLIVGVPTDEVGYVMQVMTQQRIRHLPIVDEGELCGLVSIGDVVKAQLNESEAEIRHLRSYITGLPT